MSLRQTYINVGGPWKIVDKIWKNISGTWKPDTISWIKVAGVWRKCQEGPASVSIETTLLRFYDNGSPIDVNYVIVTSSQEWSAAVTSDEGIINSITYSGINGGALSVSCLSDQFFDVRGAIITITVGAATCNLNICKSGTSYSCA